MCFQLFLSSLSQVNAKIWGYSILFLYMHNLIILNNRCFLLFLFLMESSSQSYLKLLRIKIGFFAFNVKAPPEAYGFSPGWWTNGHKCPSFLLQWEMRESGPADLPPNWSRCILLAWIRKGLFSCSVSYGLLVTSLSIFVQTGTYFAYYGKVTRTFLI